MNSHKRQSSTGSFSIDQNAFQTSFSNLENFMILTKLMQDEIMVPCKLKEKTFSKNFFLFKNIFKIYFSLVPESKYF